MLATLRIKNLALVDDLTIAFDPGLNVLTGETGAGKSVLAGAIGLVLGQRADAMLVRQGAQEAAVEASFSLPEGHRIFDLAREAGISIDPKEDLVLRRVVLSSGKSRAFLNDQAILLATLERIAGSVVDLVGQHSHQSLLKEDSHRELLDAFGRHAVLREALRSVFEHVQTLGTSLENLQRQEKEKQEKLEFYRFQSHEIEASRLVPNEDQSLAQEMELLSHAQKWQELAAGLLEALYEGEDSITHRVGMVQGKLSQAKQADGSLDEAARNVAEALVLLKDSVDAVRHFGEKVSADPQRLAAVQERLGLIESLKRKHGRSVDEILRWKEALESKITALENISVAMEEIVVELQEEKKKLAQTAEKLSEARAAAAEKLAAGIREQLGELGMEGAGLRLELEACPIQEHGAEDVRFWVAPNKGEGFKPLAAIASGGEISRILLAIKIVLSATESISTLVFDEIDANIGGSIATRVGQKLRALAATQQVIAITHLPQIARHATTHFLVSKEGRHNRTITQIKKLQDDQRAEEFTRMIGGEEAASELLIASTSPAKKKGKER